MKNLKTGQRVRVKRSRTIAAHLWDAVGTVVKLDHEHSSGLRFVQFDVPVEMPPRGWSPMTGCWLAATDVEVDHG